MKNRERVIKFVSDVSPKAICDDCLAERLDFSQRQQANIITRPLSKTASYKKPKRACDFCKDVKLSISLTGSNNLGVSNLAVANDESLKAKVVVSSLGLKSLTQIGFKKVGLWVLDGDSLQLQLISGKKLKPALYAFISAQELLYVGKTSRYLPKRLYHYQKPGPTQSTNIRMNANLIEHLRQFKVVEIYAFGDQEEKKVGDFVLDVPAGLEDDIIRKTNPRWNSRKP